MTDPKIIRNQFLAALVQTVNGLGAFISGLFGLLFLFPAMVSVLFSEGMVKLHAWLTWAPKLIQLPIHLEPEDKTALKGIN